MVLVSNSNLDSKQVCLGQAWMELHIPSHIQHRLPYAFLSRTMTISTPSMLLCKNRFLHAVVRSTSRLINRAPSNRGVKHAKQGVTMVNVYVSTCLWNNSELSNRYQNTDAKMEPHPDYTWKYCLQGRSTHWVKGSPEVWKERFHRRNHGFARQEGRCQSQIPRGIPGETLGARIELG